MTRMTVSELSRLYKQLKMNGETYLKKNSRKCNRYLEATPSALPLPPLWPEICRITLEAMCWLEILMT